MSNDYYNYGNTLIPGDLARAEDVKGEFEGIQSGLDKLPKPRSDGQGFDAKIYIQEATEEGQAATWGQLQVLEAAAEAARDAAQLAETGAEAARDAAENFRDLAAIEATKAENANVTLDGVLEQAQISASQATASKNLAADWAQKGIGLTVDGANTRSALHYSDLAKKWAENGYGVNVEGDQKSAKHWAIEAQGAVTGAKKYIGLHSAAGGTYPIAEPTIADKGKFWIINVAGTLPLGAVAVGYELSIAEDLSYQAANLNPGMITSINTKTGPSVTLTPGDLGAAPASHTHSQYLEKTDNLAAVTNKATARTNLGLGSVATLNTGTAAGNIPVRDASANIPGNITGSAASATTAARLESAKTFALTGDVTGSVSSDLSGNVSIATQVANDSHQHSSVIVLARNAPPFDMGNRAPQDYHSAGLCTVFVDGGASTWPSNYGQLLNVPSYLTNQGGGALQIWTPYEAGFTVNGNPLFRVGTTAGGVWTPWRTMLDKDYADILYLGKTAAAASATRLASARTITLSGDVSGTSPAFDGTSNISINTNLPASSMLTKIKTVDGAGSGLDADLLDGLQSSDFIRKSEFSPANPAAIWTGSVTSLSTSVLPGSGYYLFEIAHPGYTSGAVHMHYRPGFICSSTLVDFTYAVTAYVVANLPQYPGTIRVWSIAGSATNVTITKISRVSFT